MHCTYFDFQLKIEQIESPQIWPWLNSHLHLIWSTDIEDTKSRVQGNHITGDNQTSHLMVFLLKQAIVEMGKIHHAYACFLHHTRSWTPHVKGRKPPCASDVWYTTSLKWTKSYIYLLYSFFFLFLFWIISIFVYNLITSINSLTNWFEGSSRIISLSQKKKSRIISYHIYYIIKVGGLKNCGCTYF